jgi:protein-disulfide isomerase
LLLLAALAVAAVVVGVIVALTAGGDDNSSAETTSTSETTQSSRALLAGIPQQGTTLGKASAPATLVEFADPQCPFCAEWSNDTFPTVVRRFVRPGKIRIEYQGLHFIGDDSEKALRAIQAAGLQNRLWNMTEELYKRQGSENTGWVTDDVLREAGTAAGVDVDKMLADMDSARVTARIQAADALGNQLGVQGTPTFVLVKPPANPVPLNVASLEPEDFAAALSDALGS